MDLQVARIQRECRATAKKVDQDGLPRWQGPTTRKLKPFRLMLDLTFRAYGETAEEIKFLLNMLVEAKVRKLGLA